MGFQANFFASDFLPQTFLGRFPCSPRRLLWLARVPRHPSRAHRQSRSKRTFRSLPGVIRGTARRGLAIVTRCPSQLSKHSLARMGWKVEPDEAQLSQKPKNEARSVATGESKKLILAR